MADDKVRENRLRRAADRQGLILVKSRRRDPRALDYGTFGLVDSRTGAVVAQGSERGFGLTLDQVEDYVTRDPKGAIPRSTSRTRLASDARAERA